MNTQTNALYVASLCLSLMACAHTRPEVQGNGKYLLVTLAGTPMLQVDAGDEATCKTFGSKTIAMTPDVAPHTRCTPTSVASQLPFSSTMRDATSQLDVLTHFRTEDVCKKYIAGIQGAQNQRNITLSPCRRT